MSKNPAPRSKGAMLFMAAPIIFGGLLFFAVGLLAFLVWMGDTADGDRVRMRFQGSCVQEAETFISERVSAIGLGDVSMTLSATGIDVIAVLPKVKDAKEDIPLLIAQRGILSVKDSEGILLDSIDVDSATLDQDESGMPYTKIVMNEEQRKKLAEKVRNDPEGFLYFYMDDTEIVKRPNHNLIRSDELRLRSLVGGKREQMKVTVDWSIVFAHGPLPCSIEVIGVEVL